MRPLLVEDKSIMCELILSPVARMVADKFTTCEGLFDLSEKATMCDYLSNSLNDIQNEIFENRANADCQKSESKPGSQINTSTLKMRFKLPMREVNCIKKIRDTF